MTKLTEENLKTAVAKSISVAEVLKNLDMSITTSNYRSFYRSISLYKIDTSHFRGQAHLLGKNHKSKTTIPLDQILIEDSIYLGIAYLKVRLIKDGLLKYECYECGISTWKGKKLSLQLDHINGTHNDHRIENLRLLCPNCHSQTETFCGKNIKSDIESRRICECGNKKNEDSKTCRKCAANKRKKITWPSLDDLLIMINNQGYSKTAQELGVSATSVKKKIVRLPDPATG